ncbi:NAD(P)-dependent alcohol dehydrogenase [Bartonella sp. LJL80]
MKTQSIVTRSKQPFHCELVNLEDPSANEVLVRIVASGVCHTDAAVLDGSMAANFPIVLGHEGAGVVEKIGSAVTTLKVGDHVVIGFASCGHCERCLTGKNGACENFGALNFEGKNRYGNFVMHTAEGDNVSQFFGQSSFSNYSIAHESSLVKVSPDIDLRYLGPLGCGFMTGSGSVLNVMQPEAGTSLVVFGTGAVGLSALMAATLVGCTKIIAVDIHDERLELARSLGATHIINSSKEDVVATIQQITNGGANYSFETTGVDSVELQAMNCLKIYGKMLCVAVGRKDIELNLTRDIIVKSITVRGVIEGDAVPQLFIPKIIEFWKQGRFPFDKLVSFYKPDQIEQAFADSRSGKVIKPVIIFDENYSAPQ